MTKQEKDLLIKDMAKALEVIRTGYALDGFVYDYVQKLKARAKS